MHISNLNIYVVKPTIPVENLGEEPEGPGAPLILGEKKESQKKGRQATKCPPPSTLSKGGVGGFRYGFFHDGLIWIVKM